MAFHGCYQVVEAFVDACPFFSMGINWEAEHAARNKVVIHPALLFELIEDIAFKTASKHLSDVAPVSSLQLGMMIQETVRWLFLVGIKVVVANHCPINVAIPEA